MPTNLRRYDEPGHVHFLTISCYRRYPFFGTPAARDVAVDCMRRSRDRLNFRWIGYVIMPEHVHWLIYPQPPGCETPIPISVILESLKTSIGRQIKQHLRSVWADQRTLGDHRLDEWASSNRTTKPIWTKRGVDFNIDRQEKLIQKLDYCHANPVKRGLVDRAEQWSWSSYGYYDLDDLSTLEMNWNGEWPIV